MHGARHTVADTLRWRGGNRRRSEQTSAPNETHASSAGTDEAVGLSALLPDELLRLIEGRYDPARLLASPPGDAGLGSRIAALANCAGGFVLLGVTVDRESGNAVEVAGVSDEAARGALRLALERIDPPAEHLVSLKSFSSPFRSTPLALLAVRQSPSPPHLVVPDGLVLVSLAAGVRSVKSRAELDALYQRGRAERERADRQIDGMIEKLIQAHYAFYGVGVVSCTQNPTADPYLWARDNAAGLVAETGEFGEGWKLTEEFVKVRPGEVELKGDREAHGYLRITRSGCVAVGEVRRRPPGNAIGSVDDVVRRLGQMVDLGARILARAPSATIVPRLFYEGMRGQRIVIGEQPYTESAGLELDTAQFPGNLGDAADAGYRTRLSADLLTHYLAGFKVDYDPDVLPVEA
ncbi:MAG: hypothetical protein ACYDCQ_04735 [Dehalococcoidia bacterium]